MALKRAYLCDGFGCKIRCGLKNDHCRHTTDETHALIKGDHKFERVGDMFFELETRMYFEPEPQEDKTKEEVS